LILVKSDLVGQMIGWEELWRSSSS